MIEKLIPLYKDNLNFHVSRMAELFMIWLIILWNIQLWIFFIILQIKMKKIAYKKIPSEMIRNQNVCYAVWIK